MSKNFIGASEKTYVLDGIIMPETPLVHSSPLKYNRQGIKNLLGEKHAEGENNGEYVTFREWDYRDNFNLAQYVGYNLPGKGLTVIPGMTGNPPRNKMRRLIVREFFDLLYDELPDTVEFRNVLFSLLVGGEMESGSTEVGSEGASNFAALTAEKVMNVFRHLPLLHLFGGVVNGYFVPGALISGFVVPLVLELHEESDDPLLKMVKMNSGNLVSHQEYVQAVRNVAIGNVRLLSKDLTGLISSDRKPMPYGTEALPAGYPLRHYFAIQLPDESFVGFGGKKQADVLKDCLLAGVYLLQKEGYLGARSAIGCGKVKYYYWDTESEYDEETLAKCYEHFKSYIEENKDAIVAYLNKDNQVSLFTDMPSKASVFESYVTINKDVIDGFMNEYRNNNNPLGVYNAAGPEVKSVMDGVLKKKNIKINEADYDKFWKDVVDRFDVRKKSNPDTEFVETFKESIAVVVKNYKSRGRGSRRNSKANAASN